MDEAVCPVAITIRPAISGDADGIARTYLESAEYHAGLDPERYSPPTVEAVLARYREPPAAAGGITLVADLHGEIVGFVDAGLEQSHDPMHRELIYCHIAEIAVSSRHQNRGIGARLLQAAEDWGRRLVLPAAYGLSPCIDHSGETSLVQRCEQITFANQDRKYNQR